MPETTTKEMQHEILGLDQIQNQTEINEMDTSATQYMIELYKIRNGEQYESSLLEPNQPDVALYNSHFPDVHDIHGADVIMSFVNDAHKPVFLGQDRDHVVYFDMSSVSSDHILSKAELRLYKEKQTRTKQSIYRVVIFLLKGENGNKDESVTPKTGVTLSGDYDGWISINVTDAAHYWNLNRNENFGLDVRVTDVDTGQDLDLKKSGIGITGAPKNKQPFLTVFVKEKVNEYVWRTRLETRARRSASQQEGSTKCQKHPLYIDFSSLGWTHIIAPPGYNASYCAGECNYSPESNVTEHSILQSLLNLKDPSKIPKPCCSPSKLSKAQVLYTDDNKEVILKHYEDMVVEDCGCF
ncbi:hypothetical protein ACJMK2_000254 [Sinanodonta woodiana]|uniref:TGF-beta family profile domain-containing protein n=1 Tax=Sinanodonta woodiana TaxID=1069815 RepID=A0ABD3XQE5_SINWO